MRKTAEGELGLAVERLQVFEFADEGDVLADFGGGEVDAAVEEGFGDGEGNEGAGDAHVAHFGFGFAGDEERPVAGGGFAVGVDGNGDFVFVGGDGDFGWSSDSGRTPRQFDFDGFLVVFGSFGADDEGHGAVAHEGDFGSDDFEVEGGFFDDGDGEAFVVGGAEGASVVDFDVMDVFMKGAGEAALGVLDGEGGEGRAEGGVFGGGEEDGEVGGAARGGLGFDGNSGGEFVVLEDDVVVGVLAGNVGDYCEVVAAWNDDGAVLLTVVVLSVGKLGAEAGGAGSDLDDVGVVGTSAVEVIADEEKVVAVVRSFEVELGVGVVALVVGISEVLFVFGISNADGGVEGGAQGAGVDLDANVLSFFC